MATSIQALSQQPSLPNIDIEAQTMQELGVEVVDCSKRAQLILAMVSGGNHGLLSSTAFLLMAPDDVKTFCLTWLATTVSGACAMAIRKFVSEDSQYDIEKAQIEREFRTREVSARELEEMKKKLPSPLKTAAASTVGFAVGAFVPLLPAVFIEDHEVRLEVGLGTLSLALLGLGGVTAALGKAPLVKSALKVLAGEALAMAIPFGLNKWVGRFSRQP